MNYWPMEISSSQVLPAMSVCAEREFSQKFTVRNDPKTVGKAKNGCNR